MWTNKRQRNRLPREILGVFMATALLAIVCYFFFRIAGEFLVFTYMENLNLIIADSEFLELEIWIEGLSLVAAVLLFVVMFLFLVGERIAYISEIVKGIDALGRHDWDYKIPLEGNNELTELAKRVNELSREEQALREKEILMQQEKEALIRGLSHDIRTPLTSILSYSEYIMTKDELSREDIEAYAALMEQKAKQMKVLTDRLLEGGNRVLVTIEDGQLLMGQLADEWMTDLEEEFDCRVDMAELSSFSPEADVEELRRIFDNLASNVRKYANPKEPVDLQIAYEEGQLSIRQQNRRKTDNIQPESTKIGIESIRKIAIGYKGTVDVVLTEEDFSITITLNL